MSDTLLFCPMSMLSVKQTFLAIRSYDFGSIDFISPNIVTQNSLCTFPKRIRIVERTCLKIKAFVLA